MKRRRQKKWGGDCHRCVAFPKATRTWTLSSQTWYGSRSSSSGGGKTSVTLWSKHTLPAIIQEFQKGAGRCCVARESAWREEHDASQGMPELWWRPPHYRSSNRTGNSGPGVNCVLTRGVMSKLGSFFSTNFCTIWKDKPINVTTCVTAFPILRHFSSHTFRPCIINGTGYTVGAKYLFFFCKATSFVILTIVLLWRERGGTEGGKERQTYRQTDRQTQNSNSKTLILKDSSVRSIRT